MKAKELIALLQTIDPDAEVVTPGFDEYGVARDFTLKQVGILFDVSVATAHLAPHESVSTDTPGATLGYMLNGEW